MTTTRISQGPWTRIRPLQRDEVDPYTHAGMSFGEITWGGFRTNLLKVMAYCPRLTQLEVEYANSFIFDPPTFRGQVQEAGFNDRFLKELVISRVSLLNRSRYSVTHHALLGMMLFAGAGRQEEGHRKYLYLHEHEQHPEIYSERERVVLDYTAKVTVNAHAVTDAEFARLRAVLRANCLAQVPAGATAEALERLVDAHIVELTWLIGHFCLLNRWFTVLQVPEEGPQDEDNFGPFYEQVVPADIRQRNEEVLHGGPSMKGSGSLRQEGQVQVPERGAGPGKSSKISQGPWTRVRPLQRDELDAYTAAGIAVGEIIWGIRNNLCKVMAYLPRMTQTEVQYANSFIFDPPIFRGGVQETGFNDRFLKELVISRTSLFNRSRYSVTHHTFMGIALFKSAGRYEEGVSKLLHLHEHEKHPETYTEYERAVLDYTVKVAGDPHEVTDEEFERLRLVLRKNTVADGAGKQLTGGELDRFVDARIVELTWLIGHYCLLNRWFTVLQVPDETAADEDNFPQAYEAMVPLEIRQRNEALLAGTAPSPGLESKPMTRETHPNETLMKQYVDAWLRGDVAAAEAFYADDVRLHHFGHNPLAGDYIGKPALQEYLKKMLAVTDHAATLKVYNVFANDTAGVTVIRVRFERSGRAPLEGKRVTLFEIGPDRKIHDVWVRDEDQYAVDAFFS